MQAQPAAVAAATAESTKPTALEAVVVTGSNLPTAPDEVAVPVSVLGADLIDRAGVNSNVLEVLRKSLPSFAGRSNAGNSNANNNNQNTAGGSQVQLRNLDSSCSSTAGASQPAASMRSAARISSMSIRSRPRRSIASRY